MSQPKAKSEIRVAVCGALGKMGQEVVRTVLDEPGLTLVGAVDALGAGQDAAQAVGRVDPIGVSLQSDLAQVLTETQPEVCVDFTHPSVVLENTLTIIQHGVRPVVGTTGLNDEGLARIRQALKGQKLPGAVIANFAIGAVLLMRFAREAAQYLDHAEIIELHHNQKADAPSGTALRTAELMQEACPQFGKSNSPEKEVYAGARGGTVPGNLHIHSVRLPGLVAHQEVLFGAEGQLLTLRHDSFNRRSFMPGVALAVKKIMQQSPGLVLGLDPLL